MANNNVPAQNTNIELGFDHGRQMYLDCRRSTLIAFLNRLKPAENKNYHELHGKYSVIQLLSEDFSKGKKADAVYCYYNLDPETVRDIYHWVSTLYPLYMGSPLKRKWFKHFAGKFQQLELQLNPGMNNPFCIICSNGLYDEKAEKPKGDVAVVKQYYSGELFYTMWSTIYDRLKLWELIHYSALCKVMEPITARAVEQELMKMEQNRKQNNVPQQYAPQSNGNHNGNSQGGRRGNRQNNTYSPQQAQYNDMPELAPPIGDIPFEQMPDYGSAYRR